jgi:hypothetical protein
MPSRSPNLDLKHVGVEPTLPASMATSAWHVSDMSFGRLLHLLSRGQGMLKRRMMANNFTGWTPCNKGIPQGYKYSYL